MKKKLILIVAVLSSLLLLSGCGNKQIIDTTWKFNKAIIIIGEEKIEVNVESWKDYDDTTVQIKDKNGNKYLTDIKNVLLISE